MPNVAQIVTKRLSIRDAAAELGVSVDTVYRWVSEGRLDHYRLGGRISFSPVHLERALVNAERHARVLNAA